MANEQERTLAALQTAIQMEIDGKAYYLKGSSESGNELGKKLLQSQAAEEDIHRQKFEEMYNAIRGGEDWPMTDFQPNGGRKLRTIIATSIGSVTSDVKSATAELEAVKIAIDMEIKTYEFYEAQCEKATYDAEKDLYEALAGEEREHHFILRDYYEYLKDPMGWSVAQEHRLDAG